MTPRDCAPEFDPRTGATTAIDGNAKVDRALLNRDRMVIHRDLRASNLIETWERFEPIGNYMGDTNKFSLTTNPDDASDHVALHNDTSDDTIYRTNFAMMQEVRPGHVYRWSIRQAASGTASIGLTFGAVDTQNRYEAYLYTDELRIDKIDGGTRSNLDASTLLTQVTGSWVDFTLKWQTNGNILFNWGGGSHYAEANDIDFTGYGWGWRATLYDTVPSGVKVYFGTLKRIT